MPARYAISKYIEIDRLILAGWIARAQNQIEEAIELVRSAAELEGTVEKHPVSPGALLPPYEALGDLLLDLDRPAEALEAYQASDEVWPGRFNTLLGGCSRRGRRRQRGRRTRLLRSAARVGRQLRAPWACRGAAVLERVAAKDRRGVIPGHPSG